MKIYFAGDHAGFELKKDLMEFVKGLGNEVEDMGPFSYVVTDDYPDFVIPMARKVAGENTTPPASGHPSSTEEGKDQVRGIVCAGSGQGEVIAMNRVKGVRAVVYYGGRVDIVKVRGEQNAANILSIGARFIGEAEAKAAVKLWLETQFSTDERHVRRLKKIDPAS